MHNSISLISVLLLCFTVSETVMAFLPVPPQEAFPSIQLLDPAGVIGKDDRVELGNFNSQTFRGFPNPKEYYDLHTCAGWINCPGVGKASASVVGHAGQVVTAAHLFFIGDGPDSPVMDNPKRCVFHTYEGEKIRLDLTKGELERVHYFKHRNYDYTVAKLQRPVKNCSDPFRVASRDGPDNVLKEGDPIMLLSHLHADMSLKKYRGKQPIIQECRVRHVSPPVGARPGLYYTDCDAYKGSSGGLILTREYGALTARALNVAIGSSDIKVPEFDLSRGYYSLAVGIQGDFYNEVKGIND